MNVNYTISDPELRHKFYCLDPQCALRLCKQLAPGGAADAFRGGDGASGGAFEHGLEVELVLWPVTEVRALCFGPPEKALVEVRRESKFEALQSSSYYCRCDAHLPKCGDSLEYDYEIFSLPWSLDRLPSEGFDKLASSALYGTGSRWIEVVRKVVPKI